MNLPCAPDHDLNSGQTTNRFTNWLTGPGGLMCLGIVMLLALSACKPGDNSNGGEQATTNQSIPEKISSIVSRGKNLYENGDPESAITHFQEAAALSPTDVNLQLNVANAHIAAGQNEKAESLLAGILEMDRESAAAHYLTGLTHMKSGRHEEALKSFQTSELLEPNSSDFARLNNLTFQIARAHMALEQWDAAIEKLYDLSTYDENHPAVWYNLGQALIRAERTDEATEAMDMHQQQVAIRGTAQTPERDLETCRHTDIYLPFVLESPKSEGIPVTFNDATDRMLGEASSQFSGPLAIVDFNHSGTNSVWAIESGDQFRMLINNGSQFVPGEKSHPIREDDTIMEILTGDIQNSGFEDIIALGQTGTYAFNMMTNGVFLEQSTFANLAATRARKAWFADVDYTGHIDLLVLPPADDTNSASTNLVTLENIGNFYFFDVTATSSVPAQLDGLADLAIEDWNQDDMLDLIVAATNQPVQILLRERGAGFKPLSGNPDLPKAELVTTADFDNDLRPDLATLGPDGCRIILQAGVESRTLTLQSAGGEFTGMTVIDFDNDGWKDLAVFGNSLHIFRNAGPEGFVDVSEKLKLSDWPHGNIREVHSADLDNDGDSDLVVDTFDQGIRILDNDGGNANRLLKMRLDGTRSNRSGLGIQIELTSGNWRTLHTVQSLPIEIGMGRHDRIDSLSIRWSDASDGELDIEFEPTTTFVVTELRIATGSCPYLYAWNGENFEFVTDLLGAAPLGLPAAKDFLIPGDPFEYVLLGGEDDFPPDGDQFKLQVTEELREVLYLDEARLVVVDHPDDVDVYPSTKLVSGPPPAPGLVPARHRHSLTSAKRSDGMDVTEAAALADGIMVSPVALRSPQYRGLAEPWHVDIAFDGLVGIQNPILVLQGWLQFGGGMANIAGSLRKDFPFPFPRLEASTSPNGDDWVPVDIELGAPAGKTKTIVADLTGKLPEGTSRLRISTAFEIHWDQITLMETAPDNSIAVRELTPSSADLHWRGFSKMSRLNPSHPKSPDYGEVRQKPSWTHTPEGWCTRYGDVLELVNSTDNRLALLNGGDELTLTFDASGLPPVAPGNRRTFLYYNVGWDKDADFHVVRGAQVGPMPWHGMDYQRYGSETPPDSVPTDWIRTFNTRWVPAFTFDRPDPGSDRQESELSASQPVGKSPNLP